MNKPNVLSGAGLRGQEAGSTSLSTVGVEGSGLTYRGYDIDELSRLCTFEEVAFLLLKGELPSTEQLQEFQRLLASQRLPAAMYKALRLIPASAAPMDVMRTSCSLLGHFMPEGSFTRQYDCAIELLSLLPQALLYWFNFCRGASSKAADSTGKSYQIGSNILNQLDDGDHESAHEAAISCSLILYAEHEFNASTFAARVCASTLADMHSCVAAAIGTLSGPLHGGANEAALTMMEGFKDPEDAEQQLLGMLARKEKIMGFGHAIYRKSDPRNEIIKGWAKRLCRSDEDQKLFAIAQRCEEVMQREKSLFCNADFYHAPAYRALAIPTELFTPMFVCARVTGWCAHIFEQRSDNRIIRPSARYVGPSLRTVPVSR